MSPPRCTRILFVCLGNICRSPSAEAVLRAMAERRGLSDRIEIDSAATGSATVGSRPNERARAAAARRGYRLSGRARQVTDADLCGHDLVIAMDHANLRALRSLPKGTARLVLLSEWLPPGSPAEVPDPYGGTDADFDHALDLIEPACAALLDELA